MLIAVPTIVLVSLLVFLVTHLIPGDLIDAMQSRIPDNRVDRAELEKILGLDQNDRIFYNLSWLVLQREL